MFFAIAKIEDDFIKSKQYSGNDEFTIDCDTGLVIIFLFNS